MRRQRYQWHYFLPSLAVTFSLIIVTQAASSIDQQRRTSSEPPLADLPYSSSNGVAVSEGNPVLKPIRIETPPKRKAVQVVSLMPAPIVLILPRRTGPLQEPLTQNNITRLCRARVWTSLSRIKSGKCGLL